MATARTADRRTASRPLKSPLAVPSGSEAREHLSPPVLRRERLTDRAATRAEFEDFLRTTTNRDGRPYEEATISAYVCPAKTLDQWMTANGIEGDYTQADTATLNRFFREYYRVNGQGGTHTLQRNLIQLFNYLEREHAHASPPYKTGLNRYSEVKGRPKTLSADFIDELLDVTGGGKARDFQTARDHAIIAAALVAIDVERMAMAISVLGHRGGSSSRRSVWESPAGLTTTVQPSPRRSRYASTASGRTVASYSQVRRHIWCGVH